MAANDILMIRPANFTFNEKTARTNAFQKRMERLTPKEIQDMVLEEFDYFVEKLRENGVSVLVINDTEVPAKPDAVFPNNWATFHRTGEIVLYPMMAENRRLERRDDIIEKIGEAFEVSEVIDMTIYESEGHYLEGTGSMVLDRENKMLYACLSDRTDIDLLQEFSERFGYKVCTFKAYDQHGDEIYHTNVMMSVCDRLTVVCSQSIGDDSERRKVLNMLTQTGHDVLEINMDQVMHFAGNVLEVATENGKNLLVMSEQAYKSLHKDQVRKIEQYLDILHVPLYTIEAIGGGSARCMMAEIYLPVKIKEREKAAMFSK